MSRGVGRDPDPATPPPRRTALVWHERFAWYQAGIGAAFAPAGGLVQPYEPVDGPAPKARLRSLVDVSGLSRHLAVLEAVEAGDDELAAFHDRAYLERLRALADAGHGDAGFGAPVGPDAFVTAALGAGGCGVAIDAVLAEGFDNAYALVRPPGHHARAGEGVGSCLLANAVLATMRARRRHGVERVVILDWDVHHGNGAQEAFWDDPDTLTISLHQEDYFPPGSGRIAERGGDDAWGANINVPLPPGCGHGVYLEVVRQIVAPAIRHHRPDLIVVACGYDASAHDQQGRMLLHSDSFRALTRTVRELAEELCGGRLVLLQEGGYSAPYTPFCGLAVLEELVGVRVMEDPFLEVFAGMGGQGVAPWQRELIAGTVSALRVPGPTG